MFESARSIFLAVRKNSAETNETGSQALWPLTKWKRNHEPDLVFPYSDGGNYASKQELPEYLDSKLKWSYNFLR